MYDISIASYTRAIWGTPWSLAVPVQGTASTGTLWLALILMLCCFHLGVFFEQLPIFCCLSVWASCRRRQSGNCPWGGGGQSEEGCEDGVARKAWKGSKGNPK